MGSITAPDAFPPAAAARVAGKLLDLHSPHEISEAINILIDVLDLIGDDPEAEETDLEDSFQEHPGYGPGCPVSDGSGDQAWVEWHAMRGSQKRDPNLTAGEEDDEPGGDEFDHDGTEDDSPYIGSTAMQRFYSAEGAGCHIADPGGCEHDGREPDNDAEYQQMGDDVPVLPVMSYEHNPFTDQRVPLGFSNLQTSFACGGEGVRSADTGNMLRRAQRSEGKPGIPV